MRDKGENGPEKVQLTQYCNFIDLRFSFIVIKKVWEVDRALKGVRGRVTVHYYFLTLGNAVQVSLCNSNHFKFSSLHLCECKSNQKSNVLGQEMIVAICVSEFCDI